jgi:branched-chain amino acid transport system substrate-binding protein
MNPFRRSALRVFQRLLLVILLLTACLPPPLPRVIKIGLVAPFEGRYRYIGYDAIYAARLAVREINAAGGVAGWSLELAAYDDRADPEMARAAARNLVADPDVVAVIGHYRETSSGAAAEVYAEVGMPLLVVGTWLTPTGASVWSMLPPPEQVAAAMIEAASGAPSLLSPPSGGIKGGEVWGDGPLAAGLSDALQTRSYRYEPDTSAFPDVVFSTLSPVETGSRLAEWRAAGWKGTLIGDIDLAAMDFMDVAGVAGEGTFFVTPYLLSQDAPELEGWREAYRAVGPHVPDPGVYARPTYEAVYALADAIGAAVDANGQPSRAGVQMSGLGAARNVAGYRNDMALYVYLWESASLARLVGRVKD